MLVRTALLLSLLAAAIPVHGKAVTWNEAKNRSESAGLGAGSHISRGKLVYDGTREAGGNSLHHHFHVEDRPAMEREEKETQARRRVEEVARQELKEVVRQEAVTDTEEKQGVWAG